MLASRSTCAFTCFAALAVAAACEPDPKRAARPAVKRTAETGAPGVATLPAHDDLRVYSRAGKRDPFRPINLASEPDEPVTELQTWQIDQLTPVAIVSDRLPRYAMVEDPNGKGHTVVQGTLIGGSWGRVTRITDHGIVVTERRPDWHGRLVQREFSLNLDPPAAAAPGF